MPQILVADDDRDDQFLFKEAVEERFGDACHIDQVYNGVELIDRLHNPSLILPDLIVIDINMPLKDGVSALREIRADHRLEKIPVFIMSTSNKPSDIDVCKALGCNEYYQKPFHLVQYANIVNDIVSRSFSAAW